MYNFQVDTYMETVARERYAGRLNDFKALVRAFISLESRRREAITPDEHANNPRKMTNGFKKSIVNGEQNGRANEITSVERHYETESNLGRGHASGEIDHDDHVKQVLTKFINFALQHPKVLASPVHMRQWLAHEL